MYRPLDIALLRGAVAPLDALPDEWPDPADADACRAWLERIWDRPAFVEAVRQASASLAERVDAVCGGRVDEARRIRRAAVSVAGYALRATGRPTPFGLFAGVAPVSFGAAARVRWGEEHRALMRVSTEWLADVIDGLETCAELLERVDVVWSNLAVRRGRRVELPRAANRVTIRWTPVIDAVRAVAAAPIGFGALVDRMVEEFPAGSRDAVRRMLAGLVQQGYLVSGLRAPFTVTDPLSHLLDRLVEAGAEHLPATGARVRELRGVHEDVRRHNEETPTWAEQARRRAGLKQRMAGISGTPWPPLAVDVRLDCEVQLPHGVVDEMAQAAGALLRLSRQPAAEPAWRDYHDAFCDRYGTDTLVPLVEVVDLDAGLGYPASYPGSVFSVPPDRPSERDQQLLKLAWQAVLDDSREITLTDEHVRALAGEDRLTEQIIPPHIELAARIHASSAEALECGDYTILVFPARAAGTLTSRFTPVASGAGLEEAYRTLPTAIDGALPVQLSFPPVYPHSENICRVPAYLPHLLSLGEHRPRGADDAVVSLDDLAIMATRERLHLVSVSRRQVVEPQVFHALDLEKQPPPMARFLAHLPRAFGAGWLVFDWGPYTPRLPYLPRVRYRRCVLSRASWRPARADLPPRAASRDEWRQALARWRERWHCPSVIDLREPGRTLRLALDEPAHAELLRAHLDRHDDALLAEAPTAAELGWLGGHAHEIALPLVPTRPAAPSPLRGALPKVANDTHGHLPGASASAWLSARIHTHPERLGEIIADWLPVLLAALEDDPSYWFVRYRNQRQTDHLRLRIHTPSPDHHAACAHAVGEWTDRLRQQRMAGRLVFDTYHPEVGRYGGAEAIEAAEAVFATDSRVVAAGLRRPAAPGITALAVASMVHIVGGLLGGHAAGMQWLADRPVPTAPAPDRLVAREAINLAGRESPADLPDWSSEIDEAWDARARALAAYRERLPCDVALDGVIESLLHMHHNRAIGIDPDSERAFRRLARQAALAWRARHRGDR